MSGPRVHLALGALVVGTISLALVLFAYQNRATLIQTRVVQNFIPFFHSVRKFPDVFFFPYYFRETGLPVYTLDLSESDIQKLNASLPENPFGTQSLNELERVEVRAGFTTSDGFESDVRVRYRGSLGNNWNTAKKSYMIDFPNASLYGGMKELSLFLPSDRDYFAEALNLYRARKLGIRAPEMRFVRLNVNNRDQGVYVAMEHWSQEWLEKSEYAAESTLLGIRTSAELEGKYAWRSWNKEEELVAKPTSPALGGDGFQDTPDVLVDALTDIVGHASDRDFEMYAPYILDLPKFYAYDVVSILAGSYHGDGWLDPDSTQESQDAHSGDNNVVLVFNSNTGLFEPMPYNVSIHDVRTYPEGFIPVEMPQYLSQRLHAIPAFRAQRDAMLKSYIEDPANKEDDMRFIEEWERNILPELYTDNVKIETNFAVRSTVARLREVTLSNFDKASYELEREYPRPAVDIEPIRFRGTFTYLDSIAASPTQFVARNPQFYLASDGTVHLGGSVTLYSTVIVPRGTRLVIDDGANIRLGKDMSLITYSPVTAHGGAGGISFGPATSFPWGNFAVINARRETSFIDNIHLKRGGDTWVNGVHYSGMLTFKDSDSVIHDVLIEEAQGDDGIHLAYGSHVIKDSLFKNNWADPIDADFVDDVLIENNVFINTKSMSELSYDGDAADISGSRATLRGNIVAKMGDKGFSVGENSSAFFEKNVIVGNPIGVAVKDLSQADLVGNVFIRNETALALYKKKNLFGGGKATSTGNLLLENGNESEVDEFSELQVYDTEYPSRAEIIKFLPPAYRSLVP